MLPAPARPAPGTLIRQAPPATFSRRDGRRGAPASLKDGVSGAITGTTPVSIRLADDVLAHYRGNGGDWEARVNAALREAMEIEG